MSDYERPSWDDYFFEVVDAISKRATCDRGRSGCIIVKNNQILSTGYVGSPPGFLHCDDVGHIYEKRKRVIKMEQIKNFGTEVPDNYTHKIAMKIYESQYSEHCIRTIHAEQNAICQAAKNGISIRDATLYCRMTPCRTCTMLIIASGIKEVKSEFKYHAGKESEELFEKAKINISFRNNEVKEYGDTSL